MTRRPTSAASGTSRARRRRSSSHRTRCGSATRTGGPDGVEEGHAAAWKRFAPVVADWVDVAVANGPEGLRADWLEVLAGATPPRTGHVIQL